MVSQWRSWRHGHWGSRPRGTYPKIEHRFRIFAEWQAKSLTDLRGCAYDVYACRWGEHFQDGEIYPLHWHVGKPKKESS